MTNQPTPAAPLSASEEERARAAFENLADVSEQFGDEEHARWRR